jgi:hypothetical protein
VRAVVVVIGVAAPFVWLGMVLAISFVETPLKFRAPGITVPLGLGIGRLVFRALNLVEIGLAVPLTASWTVGGTSDRSWVLVGAVWVLLVVQIGVLRPRLDRRTLAVIAGRTLPASRHHLFYIALEVIKVVLLALIGATAATAVAQ